MLISVEFYQMEITFDLKGKLAGKLEVCGKVWDWKYGNYKKYERW